MTMTKERHQALSSLVSNALLHIHSSLYVQARFVPVAAKNAAIVKWLKPKLTEAKYALVKKDIKTLILTARKNGGNVEAQLWTLNKQAVDSQGAFTDANTLYNFLTELFEKHGIKSHLSNPDEELESNVICVAQSEIEEGFNDDNQQIRPILLQMKTDTPDALLAAVSKCSGSYNVTLKACNDGIADYSVNLMAA